MDAKSAMNAFLIQRVSPFLRDRGFHRRGGNRYEATRDPNTVFVRFQRVGDLFTCDIGVISEFLRREFESFPEDHWTIRLGPVAVGYDRWWDLSEDADEVAADFLPALARGLEHIESIATDEGLRDAFLRLVMSDPRPLAPIHEAWVMALIRSLGAPAWVTDLARPAD